MTSVIENAVRGFGRKLAIVALAALGSSAAYAVPTITVGTNIPVKVGTLTTISIPVTGGDLVNGLQIFGVLGDGSGAANEPIFSSAGFGTGTIWAGQSTTITGGPVDPNNPSTGTHTSDIIIGVNLSGSNTAGASGTAVTFTIDATGFTNANIGSSFALLLKSSEAGGDTTFTDAAHPNGVTTTVNNGSIQLVAVPEPASLSLVGVAAAAVLGRRRRSR